MTWIVALEDYEVVACHGAFDFEQVEAQPFVISVWVNLNSGKDVPCDLTNTVDYGLLQTAIDEEIRDGPPARLMEELCRRLVERLNPNLIITSIRVRIEKPEAPLPHPGGLPLVEYHWSRD